MDLKGYVVAERLMGPFCVVEGTVFRNLLPGLEQRTASINPFEVNRTLIVQAASRHVQKTALMSNREVRMVCVDEETFFIPLQELSFF
jgi:hypothetical protein